MTTTFQTGDRLRVTGNDESNPAGTHVFRVGQQVYVTEVALNEGVESLIVRGEVEGAGTHVEQWVLPADLAPLDPTHPVAPASLDALLADWRKQADTLDETPWDESAYDPEGEARDALAETLRQHATQVELALGLVDISGSASRQHFIDTGRYLRHDETEEV